MTPRTFKTKQKKQKTKKPKNEGEENKNPRRYFPARNDCDSSDELLDSLPK